MSPSTNTRSVSTEKLNISTGAITIPVSPLPFLDQDGLDTTFKEILASLNEIFDQQHEEFSNFNEDFDKQHDKLIYLTTMSLLPHRGHQGAHIRKSQVLIKPL